MPPSAQSTMSHVCLLFTFLCQHSVLEVFSFVESAQKPTYRHRIAQLMPTWEKDVQRDITIRPPVRLPVCPTTPPGPHLRCCNDTARQCNNRHHPLSCTTPYPISPSSETMPKGPVELKMSLTEEHIKIILERPLNDTLDNLRNNLPNNNADDPQQENIAGLLTILLGTPAAFSLYCPDGSGNIAAKLFPIQQQVRAGVVKLDLFLPLVRHVVDKSSDINIWQAVFDLINILGALTPPPSSIPPTFRGTPIKASSSRLADSEMRDIVEGELFEEIKHCTFRNVGGFWDKFFDPKSWRKEQNAMLKGILTVHDGKRWTDFPTVPDEKPVWDWLRSLEEHFLDGAPYKLHTTRTANQFQERKGQMDLFLQKPAIKAGNMFWYKHVLVVGEQKKSYDTSRFKADLLQLTRYVRSVFADQPTRRFVHAFSFCASKMEL
jgi:hypothetical protein